ncbi:MAG: hypothetical protein JWN90_225 [Parcubacteria group bacterium]|nr:hypothetical protein [Parcubacteria group bacterium]
MKNLKPNFGSITRIFRYGDRINPTRDWFLLLGVTAIALCMSVAWNIWLFSRVTSGEAIGTATSTPATTNIQLDSIQSLFSTRSAERARYVNTYRFVDPSL